MPRVFYYIYALRQFKIGALAKRRWLKHQNELSHCELLFANRLLVQWKSETDFRTQVTLGGLKQIDSPLTLSLCCLVLWAIDQDYLRSNTPHESKSSRRLN